MDGTDPAPTGASAHDAAPLDLDDEVIWASTCDLTAQVLRGKGYVILESDGFTYRASPRAVPVSKSWDECGGFTVRTGLLRRAGAVAWSGGTLPPGAGGVGAKALAVLMNRYRARYGTAGL